MVARFPGKSDDPNNGLGARSACLLAAASPSWPQSETNKKPVRPASKTTKPEVAPLTERQRVLHALNRLTFGPRPGEVDAVLAKGWTPGSKTSCIPRVSTIRR